MKQEKMGFGMQWHQLDHVLTICTSRQITTPTPHHSIFTGQMLFLAPNQQYQSPEGIRHSAFQDIWYKNHTVPSVL